MTGGIRRPLMLLLGAASLVLLVACSNLASTFLARAHNREREIAIRSSLGAVRGRIVRQLFTEAILLTGIGTAGGLVVAALLVKGLVALAPTSVPLLDAVGIDGPVLTFTVAAAALTATLFGLLPGIQISGRNASTVLQAGSRGSSGTIKQGAWRFLVASEVALAVVLLVGSGLLIRSFAQVMDIETGFDSDRVVVSFVELPELRYAGDPEIVEFYGRLDRAVAAMPGVIDVGIVASVPLDGSFSNGMIGIDGGDSPTALGIYQVVSGGYFTTLGIPLLQGRLFDDRDDASTPDVAIVSESFAELAWPGQDPIGRRINGGGMDNYLDPDVSADAAWYLRNRWATVVGVVGDLRQRSLTGPPEATYYFHYQQRPARARWGAVVAKIGIPATTLLTELRTISNNLDPMIPTTFRLMDRVLGDSVANRRFTLTIMGAFAGLALLLSALGIYGVVSYFVARRTREMGIRLALGAEPGSVRALVQRGAMSTALLGVLAGVAGSIAIMRLMESLLYEVSPYDPVTLTGVVVLLAGAAWLASYLPARRTSRIDPIVTMKAE